MKPSSWPDQPPPDPGRYSVGHILGLVAVGLIALVCLSVAIHLRG